MLLKSIILLTLSGLSRFLPDANLSGKIWRTEKKKLVQSRIYFWTEKIAQFSKILEYSIAFLNVIFGFGTFGKISNNQLYTKEKFKWLLS